MGSSLEYGNLQSLREMETNIKKLKSVLRFQN